MFFDLVQQDVVDGDRPIPAVQDQRHSIVVKIDGPNEDVDQAPAGSLVIDVAPFEGIQKGFDLRGGEGDLFSHFHGELRLQLTLFLLPLLNALCNHLRRLPMLQSFPEVFNGGVRLLDGRFDAPDGGAVVIRFAGGGNRGGDLLNVAVGQQLPALQNDPILDALLSNHFLLTQLPFGVLAGVVAVRRPGFACAAVAGHHLAAVAAKELGRQQVFFPPSAAGRCRLVLVQDALYPLKQLVLDDARHPARRFRIFVDVIADVPLVPQKAVQAVLVERLAQRGFDLLAVEIGNDLGDGLAAGVQLENLPHRVGSLRVDMKPPLLVHIVAEAGIATVGQALFRVDVHTPADFLGQLRRVVFGHTLQHALHQNPAGIVADVLPRGDHPDAVLFQLGLIDGAVVAVASETVQLIDKDGLKGVSVAVGDHALEVRAAVRRAALRPINVFADHRMSVVLCVVIAGLKLSLNGLFRLTVAGIAGIDHDIHSFTSRSICSSVSFSLPFIGEFGSKHISTNFSISGVVCVILGLYSYSLPCGLSVRPKM